MKTTNTPTTAQTVIKIAISGLIGIFVAAYLGALLNVFLTFAGF